MAADTVGDYIIMGELSLDGGLQPIKGGALPIAIEARKKALKVLSFHHKMHAKPLLSTTLKYMELKISERW